MIELHARLNSESPVQARMTLPHETDPESETVGRARWALQDMELPYIDTYVDGEHHGVSVTFPATGGFVA